MGLVIVGFIAAAVALVGALLTWRNGREANKLLRTADEREARQAEAAATVERSAHEWTVMKETLNYVVEDQKRTRGALLACLRRDSAWREWASVNFPGTPPPPEVNQE